MNVNALRLSHEFAEGTPETRLMETTVSRLEACVYFRTMSSE
jgi:hypothetical protein